MAHIPKWSTGKRFALALALVTAAVLVVACATSPLGRSQLMLVPEAQMVQMGSTAFTKMKSSRATVAADAAVSRYVRCIAAPITRLLGSERQWEVVVFEDDTPNAFALPGGKIGVHTGILEVADTQDQLAAIIGHEVAHVISRHGAERVSQQFATSQALSLVQAYTANQSTATQRTVMGLLGLGAQVGVLLPYSRVHESEADLVGLDLMARAGFDPRGSVQLWRNMQAAAGGQRPPQWLSTHPHSENRIEALQQRMPSALEIYRQARSDGRRPDCRVP